MQTLHFKTNMSSRDCVLKASEQIDKINTIKNWEVTTSTPEPVMTVRGTQLETNKIITAAKKAGFKAQLLA